MRLTSLKLAGGRRCLLHGRVRQGPEIRECARQLGRIHHTLGEEDADHPFRGIGVSGCAEAAVPTETAFDRVATLKDLPPCPCLAPGPVWRPLWPRWGGCIKLPHILRYFEPQMKID